MNEAICRKCGSSVLPFAEVCSRCGVQFPTDEFLGSTIRNNIELESVLGVGGMGTVYKGIEKHLQRPVAVKVLNNMGMLTQRHVAYFMREAQVLSRLRHPNLVAVLDFGQESDGTLFLVLEYIPGQTLDDLLDKEFPLSHTRALRILIQILSALEEVHRHNIIHRDLKPGNVQLEEVAGQKDFVKVLDFGIAKIAAENDGGFFHNGSSTEFGTAVGTPQYMSPEQTQGHPLDGRSDIYSAGLILFEMLTGRLPHASDNILDMMVQRIGEDVAAPSVFSPQHAIPPALDALCLRALARDPTARFADPAAFREAAQAALVDMLTGQAQRDEVLHLRTTPPQKPPAKGEPQRASGPSGEGQPGGGLAALAIRPLVMREAANGPHTEADRLMAIWDFIAKVVKRAGGTMRPPSAGMALAIFQSGGEKGGGLLRAAQTALGLREAASRRYAYARLQMGLTQAKGASGESQSAAIDASSALAGRAMGGQILCAAEVEAALEEIFQLAPWEDQVELVGLRDAPQSSPSLPGVDPADALALAAGYVGRREARRRLDSLWGRIQRGEPGEPLLLVGPDGAGKSHTVAYLRRMARASGVPVFEAHVDKQLIDRPFRPLLDLAIQASGQRLSGASKNSRVDPGRLRRGLELLGLSTTEVAALVEQFISGTGDDPWLLFAGGVGAGLPFAKVRRALHVFAPFERRLALAGAMVSLLERITASGCAVVVLEEIDGADAGTLGCLPGLCEVARRTPLLLIATARVGTTPGLGRFEQVDLAPLTTHEIGDFWEKLKARRAAHSSLSAFVEPSPGQERAILTASRGNPLYLSRWLERPIEPPPESTAALIREQFVALPGQLRRLLLITSILGCYFEEASLESLFPKATSLAPALDGAAQGSWLEPCPDTHGLWRFTNPAIHRAIYQDISAQDRQNYHRHIFDRLRDTRALDRQLLLKATQATLGQLDGDIPSLAEQMGDRFTIAGDPALGCEWYMTALDALGRLGQPQPDDLRLKAASTLAMSNQTHRAIELLDAAPLTTPTAAARATMLKGRFLIDTSALIEALECCNAALDQIDARDPLAAGLHVLAAEASARLQDETAGIRHSEEARRILDNHRGDLPDDLLHLPWQALVIQGSIATRLGRIDDAVLILQSAVLKAREAGDKVGTIQSLQTFALLLLRHNKPGLLYKLCQETLHNDAHGLQPSHIVSLHKLIGQSLSATKRDREALASFEVALEGASRCGWRAIIPKIERLIQESRQRLASP